MFQVERHFFYIEIDQMGVNPMIMKDCFISASECSFPTGSMKYGCIPPEYLWEPTFQELKLNIHNKTVMIFPLAIDPEFIRAIREQEEKEGLERMKEFLHAPTIVLETGK